MIDNTIFTNELKKLFLDLANCKDKALKSDDIIIHFNSIGLTLKGNKLRALIGDLRKEDALKPSFIVSDVDSGYWLSSDETELTDYIEKQLYRMSHQYDNIQSLHLRIRQGKNKNTPHQQMMLTL